MEVPRLGVELELQLLAYTTATAVASQLHLRPAPQRRCFCCSMMGTSVLFKSSYLGVPLMAQQKQIRLGTMRFRVRSLASLSVLRIWHCHELWCRLQMQLGCGFAVAVAKAGSCS